MFLTNPQFELKIPALSELDGEDDGVRYWRAFEFGMDYFSYIVECLVEEGDGESGFVYWEKVLCFEIQYALQLIASKGALEHRLNLVIPTYASSDDQMQIKPVSKIFSDVDDTIEVTTGDGERYVVTPLLPGEEGQLDKRLIYSNPNTYARGKKIL